MANRHKVQAKAHGGKVFYAGGDSKVAKEALEKKDGGKVVGKVPGRKAGGRLDKRARGGGVGADKNPYSSAKMGK